MESSSMASTSGTSGCIPENGGVMGAFHEIAPYSCTPPIPIQKPSFDVFINHRGPDVKTTLASRIYHILESMKVPAFLDTEELEYGDFLPKTIEAAIRSATVHIAIFSKRYAESAWCLEELSLMLKSGAKIVPIFYYVEPSDLRFVAQGKGKYVAAFNKHEKKCRYSPEKLQEWKKALSDISLYRGQIIGKNDDEMRLYKNIVNIVLKEIRNVPLLVAKHPVGLKETAEKFENTLRLTQSSQGFQIVGIWGMGGSGKTTLAKELYNRNSSSMERSCFIFDIREAKGVLQNKQIQLLKGLGVDQQVENIEQGKAIIAKHLRSYKVLIVMDDVDDVDQLDALLPARDNLGRGSLIIVTTRECDVLISSGINSIYKMEALDPFNAKQLFCWHAFLHPSPIRGFEELVEKFIEACHGLPLSLKVFGGQLYGKVNKQYWESLFDKISRILPKNIKDKLKISYDALDDEEKEAFLDTACFFLGEEKSLAIEVWDGSGWSGLYTWEKLLNKCLVEVDANNHIRMHDHLRDLGREIANQHSPSRIWSAQQIIDYGKQTKKTNSIRGIKVGLLGREEQANEEHLRREISLLNPSSVGLKLLSMEGNYFNEAMSEASRELLWLRWSNIQQRNLPTQLSLKNLRVLHLSVSYGQQNLSEDLWEAESDAPLKLRELVISYCDGFRRFPSSIGCLIELRKIVIRQSRQIDGLPEAFCRLQSLEHLELRGCRMLSSLPNRFVELTNLQVLDLSDCCRLRKLPVSFKNLISLKYLDFQYCKKLMLGSDDFENITKLEYLNLFRCTHIEELPKNITNQASLRCLYLEGVKRLKELPIKIDQLSRLREIKIGSQKLISLPTTLGNLSSLTNLTIYDCPKLESLPNSLGNSSSLTNLLIERRPISQVDFSFALTNLTFLSIRRTGVCRVSFSQDCYPRLQKLDLFENNDLTEITALPVNLESLMVRSKRIEIVEGIQHCTRLETLILWTDSERLEVPCIESLENLRTLNLKTRKGSDVESCIQKIEKWADEITVICTRVVPEASSLVESFKVGLSENENISVDDSFYNNSFEVGLSENENISVDDSFFNNSFEVGLSENENISVDDSFSNNSFEVELSENENISVDDSFSNNSFEVGLSKNENISVDDSFSNNSFEVGLTENENISVDDSFSNNSSEVGLSENENISVDDSFSNNSSNDTLAESKLVVQNQSSTGNAIMLCFVVNMPCYDSALMLGKVDTGFFTRVELAGGFQEGRWGVIVVLPQRSRWLTGHDEFRILDTEKSKRVERGLAVRGEEQRLVMEAIVPLLQSISS